MHDVPLLSGVFHPHWILDLEASFLIVATIFLFEELFLFAEARRGLAPLS
jgi:hypothetical protein